MFKEKYFNKDKERRKKYRKSKRIDKSCRNNGECPYCRNNRTHSTNKRKSKVEDTEDFTLGSN